MAQETFFSNAETQPLAARLRPRTLEEFVGQQHLLGEGKVLRRLIENDRISSMIFWGPPGVGKTTLARIIAGKPNPHSSIFLPSPAASRKSARSCKRQKKIVDSAKKPLFL